MYPVSVIKVNKTPLLFCPCPNPALFNLQNDYTALETCIEGDCEAANTAYVHVLAQYGKYWEY